MNVDSGYVRTALAAPPPPAAVWKDARCYGRQQVPVCLFSIHRIPVSETRCSLLCDLND